MVYISQAAAQEIERLKSSRQKPNSRLRLQIKSGGCSGLFYSLDLESASSKTEQEGDRLYESHGIQIVVDAQSVPYVIDLKLDYSEDLMGGGFRFQNPATVATCGCGLSFAELKK